MHSNSSNSSITALVPGGVVTTQNISTVIRPQGNNNSLQFVKIQTPELSKAAIEQIKIAEETKITKEKSKEGEEEWQNNLLSWKSKRRQQFTHTVEQNPFDNVEDITGGRKIKTFAEILEQREKSGNRLGFNLQRYIGTDDDDTDEPLSNERELKHFSSDSEQFKNRADSDYEAHSSTSSGYNNLDSKSPSSPNIVPDIPEVDNRTSKSSTLLEFTCDKNSNICHSPTEREKHSISLVQSSKADQLNSTLKPGVKPPVPANRHDPKTYPPPKVDNRMDRTYSKVAEESDNSGFEEDDEEEEQEEEEQKQLQRIAFEAKLKAFESLTRPATQAPKFVPKPNLQKATSIPNRTIRTEHAPPVPIVPRQQSIQSIPSVPSIPSSTNLTSIPSATSISSTPSASSISSTTSSASFPSPKSINSIPSTKSITNVPSIPTTPSITSTPSNPSIMSNPSATSISSAQSIPNIPNIPIIPSNFNPPNSVQKPRNLPVPSIPDSPRSISSQRKSSRSEKDKNTGDKLSISGKKRCSSCGEELGRGAAAFVVESLSLVYHTNCFRCSVCHVNLSNGIRGVDVRVHAGALHCQDCYSKDGLNYSRV